MRTGQVIASAQEKLAAVRSTRKRRLIIVAVLAIVIVVPSVSGKKSLVKIFRMSKTRAELQQEITRLRQINEDLAREIQAFSHNSGLVEAIAREDLGLVRAGEIVYQFGPMKPTAAPSVPSR
ncbi:septum formation initiator family protein [Candidatus Methylomirabilis sp.]|uniref:Septum formation initiator family protein n=1 Tax=Candidatus Methylomirabilis tolerans TaxID=3123416 RepID=A0AAJ1AJ12_9BACT|nr:septum formation initiator family protein [Candidatus Methylomirabilis sp.]